MICRHCNTRSAFYTGKFHRKKHPIVGGNKVRWVKGRKRPEINDILLMTIFSYIAFVGSLPGLIIEITNYSFFFPTVKGLIILSVIIIFPSLLAQILFMKGVKIVGPSLSGLYTNLVPLFTSVLAIIVLDEDFHIYHLISLIVIFLGIYIFDRKKI